MLELWILRHAHSGWDGDSGSDHERPLSARGRRSVRELGEFLAARNEAPSRILCSTAMRARQTVELLAATAGWDVDVRHTRDLYEATASGVLSEIRTLDDESSPLLVAGHQPASADLASRLIGGCSFRMPTAGLISIGCEIDRWSSLRFGNGSLLWMTIPRIVGGSN